LSFQCPAMSWWPFARSGYFPVVSDERMCYSLMMDDVMMSE
jgi:hypothetical protein